MANIYKGTLGLIGNTPLIEAINLEKAYNLEAKLLFKLEYFNPAGSVKDRIAKAMIEDAEAKKVLLLSSRHPEIQELVLQHLRQPRDTVSFLLCRNP